MQIRIIIEEDEDGVYSAYALTPDDRDYMVPLRKMDLIEYANVVGDELVEVSIYGE